MCFIPGAHSAQCFRILKRLVDKGRNGKVLPAGQPEHVWVAPLQAGNIKTEKREYSKTISTRLHCWGNKAYEMRTHVHPNGEVTQRGERSACSPFAVEMSDFNTFITQKSAVKTRLAAPVQLVNELEVADAARAKNRQQRNIQRQSEGPSVIVQQPLVVP
ncbi:hypothetical protein CIHG_06433 [Coccidioides immitis H538.4]|uniref:Uncharacterized protein n=3 Tax=Coccidioides immitis TaxID=5501 RepID=A0A0J8QUZ3_COCIT|nr:hypothetical protein CIRG_10243 [Coccidioides immitis RMSCC 2394]KMU76689.1 hypothetical protein CISG_05832 [Coccidioides immitis RMSCC 3703]KMU88765.1 hypothetical protein CIHG_06433 [Coccidioides immitis H538.4]